MTRRFLTADVFTDRPFGGNPLAVLPEASGLSNEQMQRIAAEFNLSETAFVLPPDDPRHARRVRIFTPASELPFAGHPTIGTAIVLASVGEIDLVGDETRIVLEEGAGPVPVTIRRAAGGTLTAQLTAPIPPRRVDVDLPDAAAIAAAVSLDAGDLQDGAFTPEVWSAGVPFLIVAVRDLDMLARARIDPAAWDPIASHTGLREVYLFTHAAGAGADVRVRMFAPGLGIAEDPATGGGAAAFAGYLAVRTRLRDGTACWVIHQGVEMGRPSVLEIEADKRDGVVIASRVSGTAVLVMEGTLTVGGN